MDNPRDMPLDKVLAEMQEIRERIAQDARRLGELGQMVGQRARQPVQPNGLSAEQEPDRSRYRVFAHSWVRFGGMVIGGLKRAATFDRLLAQGVKERQELAEQKARKEARELAREQARQAQAPKGPFDILAELYGEMTDAPPTLQHQDSGHDRDSKSGQA